MYGEVSPKASFSLCFAILLVKFPLAMVIAFYINGKAKVRCDFSVNKATLTVSVSCGYQGCRTSTLASFFFFLLPSL